MSKMNFILGRLKARGYRITRARKAILDILFHNKTLHSAQELKYSLSKLNIHVNKTTVYRELDFLKAQKLIREIEFGDGMKRFEMWPDDHHHHLFCVRCNDVQCIGMEHCLVAEEKKISKENNFKIIRHSLKFFGLCARCQ